MLNMYEILTHTTMNDCKDLKQSQWVRLTTFDTGFALVEYKRRDLGAGICN